MFESCFGAHILTFLSSQIRCLFSPRLEDFARLNNVNLPVRFVLEGSIRVGQTHIMNIQRRLVDKVADKGGRFRPCNWGSVSCLRMQAP